LGNFRIECAAFHRQNLARGHPELVFLNPHPGYSGGCPRLEEDYEVQYWSEKFGVSQEELAAAVEKVGPMASDVKRELKTHSPYWTKENDTHGANRKT